MKIKLVRRSIEDQEADHVLELAHAGMARKLIATEVYGSDASGDPFHASLMRVHHILAYWGVRCTDYRKGKNKLGKSMIAAIRREANEADLTELIRGFGKETKAAMQKTG